MNSGRRIIKLASDNTLEGNIAQNNFAGFFLRNSSNNNVLEGNTAQQNSSSGFLLFIRADNNELKGNVARENTFSGFTLSFFSVNNVLEENEADDNGGHGYTDDSTGGGTAGTANTYVENECSNNTLGGSFPPGLCSPQP